MSINVIKYNSPPSALWKYQGGVIIFNFLIIWGLLIKMASFLCKILIATKLQELIHLLRQLYSCLV